MPSAAARHGRERQLLFAAGHLPESEMTVAGQLAQRARIRQRFEFAARKIRRAARDPARSQTPPCARAATMRSAAASPSDFHQAQSQPQRGLVIRAALQRAIPITAAHTDGPHFNAVIARIAHQLRRRIEPHGLAVDERAGEGRGFVTLQPRRAVHQQRETRGVRFGETVFAETLDLAEDLARETFVVAARAHAVDEPLLEMPETAAPLPRRHAPAQLIRLARREARGDDGELHHLLLEDRHPEACATARPSPHRWDRSPARDPAAGVDRDAPCRPGWDRGARWPLR